MPRIDVRRTLAVLLLVLTLTPALSWAGERRPEPRDEVVILESRLLPAMWRFLGSVWEKTGSSLDPSGEPRPNEGASLDPNGSTADAGSDLDPSG
ncbi:MAG: hypothetical protein ACJ759_10625 [Thermoanaerobaculia bacterium]